MSELSCASPVSVTPVSNFLPVLLTPVKLSKTVRVSLTGVVDTGEELLSGVNDTGNACCCMLLTPAKHRYNQISLRIIEIVSGHVYWAQEEQFDEKNQR
jgi:hypothetical protein